MWKFFKVFTAPRNSGTSVKNAKVNLRIWKQLLKTAVEKTKAGHTLHLAAAPLFGHCRTILNGGLFSQNQLRQKHNF